MAAEPSAAGPSVDAAAVPADNGEILVTARKRAEDILKTPVAITALSSADIAVRGITTINDIAAFTPGLNINNNSAGRNDRSFQQIIIRGFTPSTTLATTVSLFIDGVPVSSPSAFTSISDPERVEILKGPQSAYFGRNTFAGAINVVNKLPADTLDGSVSGMVGTRQNYKLHGDISGPLIGDKLSFRISADKFSKNGSYQNSFSPGQTLGDQSTRSVSLLLVAKPFENLTIKGFGLISEDKDGPPAQGIISAFAVTDASGNVIVPNQSNCTLAGRTSGIQGQGTAVANPYICGVTPRLQGGTPSANTTLDSYITNFLANPKGRLINPADGTQGYGLKRTYRHVHLTADYEIPDTDVTLSSLTGYNKEQYSELDDLDNVGTTAILNNGFGPPAAAARSYFDFPFLVERKNKDFSQEFRAAYDNGSNLRVNVGASYLTTRGQSGLGGTNGALGTAVFSTVSGATKSRTKGAFFGVSYNLTDALTLNVEGRYQIDTLYALAQPGGLTATTSVFIPAGFYSEGQTILRAQYKNFLPRVIAQYQIVPELMAYASYSKGVNPGQFNTTFLTNTPAVQRAAAAAGIAVGVKPEKVTNYEIGFKGRAFDSRLRFSLAAYYAQWRNQINTIAVTAIDTTTNLPQIVSGSANTGSVNLKGVEIDGTFFLSDALHLNFGGAYNDSRIKSFQGPSLSQLTGIFDYSGKENPNTSKWSATFGAQYGTPIAGMPDVDWFIRGDYTFKSGVWSDAANIVKTPNLSLVNTRIGISKGPVSVEGFVTNVFNSKKYTSIADNFIFTNNFSHTAVNSALIVGLPELRVFGLQMRYKF